MDTSVVRGGFYAKCTLSNNFLRCRAANAVTLIRERGMHGDVWKWVDGDG